jgi:nitrogen-specific signal transduction histidine kinase
MRPFVCSTQWLAVTLSSEAKITSLSSGAEQLTGYSAQELVGKSIAHILEDNSAFEVPKILKAAAEWGHWEGTIRHKMRGSMSLDAHCLVTSLAGTGNKPVGYILQSSLNKSESWNDSEISAVTEIADSLRSYVHNMNNPLAVIMGFTQLLMINENCQGQMRQDMEKLFSELKHVIQIVERLQRYAYSLYPENDSQEELGIRRA